MLRQTTNTILRLCLDFKPFEQMDEIESQLLIDNIVLLREVVKKEYTAELKFIVCKLTGLNYKQSYIRKPSQKWQQKLNIKTSYQKRSELMKEYYDLRLKEVDNINVLHVLKMINKILKIELW